jgi:hypothetical protein
LTKQLAAVGLHCSVPSCHAGQHRQIEASGAKLGINVEAAIPETLGRAAVPGAIGEGRKS